MFEVDDIKLYAIIGVIIIIGIGYFMFLMYNDLLTIKQQLKTDCIEDHSSSEYEPSDQEDLPEEFEEDEPEDFDFEDHANAVFESLPTIKEEVEDEVPPPRVEELFEEDIQEITEEPLVVEVKKRAYKKKKNVESSE